MYNFLALLFIYYLMRIKQEGAKESLVYEKCNFEK